nr:hypothetical protein Iba_scaffold796385CG0010 [Ipomoea batatas]GMD41586.1 hypothetical protein Iba_chr10bCG1130 [Ipomoea batatas]
MIRHCIINWRYISICLRSVLDCIHFILLSINFTVNLWLICYFYPMILFFLIIISISSTRATANIFQNTTIATCIIILWWNMPRLDTKGGLRILYMWPRLDIGEGLGILPCMPFRSSCN